MQQPTTRRKTVVSLPHLMTLREFKQEVYNLYYHRDYSAIEKLLDGLENVSDLREEKNEETSNSEG
jgi:hypothetical protein